MFAGASSEERISKKFELLNGDSVAFVETDHLQISVEISDMEMFVVDVEEGEGLSLSLFPVGDGICAYFASKFPHLGNFSDFEFESAGDIDASAIHGPFYDLAMAIVLLEESSEGVLELMYAAK